MAARLRKALIVSALMGLAGCSSISQMQAPVTGQTTHKGIEEGFKEIHRVAGRKDESTQVAWRKQLRDYTNDDRYACRRPLYARHFMRHQSFSSDNEVCPKEIPFHLTNGLEADEIVWLN